jgi:hypothetical protein
MKRTTAPGNNIKRPGPARTPFRPLATPHTMQDDFSDLKEAASMVQQLRLNAQRELEMARKIRSDAQRYQQQAENKARSEAQQLILRTRLATQRDIEELIRKASDEIQKILADIRVIRISAQEELAAQRKFTDAAKLCSMSMAVQEEYVKPSGKGQKQLVNSK